MKRLILLTVLIAGCSRGPSALVIPPAPPKPIAARNLGSDPWVIRQSIDNPKATVFVGGNGKGTRLDMHGDAVSTIDSRNYDAKERIKRVGASAQTGSAMQKVELDFRTGAYKFIGTHMVAEWVFDPQSNRVRSRRRSVTPTSNRQNPPDREFDDVLSRNRKLNQLNADIEIDGPVADQQALRSFLWAMRTLGTSPKTPPAPPFGASSDLYDGHLFWDADVWMLPVQAFFNPAQARAIADYRLQRLSAAQRNAREHGARYPWQSGTTGRELASLPFTEELHISGDVAWGLKFAASLGLADRTRAQMVTDLVGEFYRSRMTKRPDGLFDLKKVLGHDEYKKTDNDLVTNVLAQWTLNGGRWEIPAQRPQLYLPRDRTTFLTYEGDRQITYKQAAAVLSIFPFQFPAAEREAPAMMKRFASATDPNGPAMTEAIYATIWARLGDPERAYTEWRQAWTDFTANQPLLHFSEVRKQDRAYFMTGAAGCLQTVLYGFAGFRIDYRKEPDAAWTKKLREGKWLSVKPRLPRAWKRMTLKNLILFGQRYTLIITHNGVLVKQGDR